MPLRINLIGKRFGRLTVVKLFGSDRGITIWLCKCDCGNTTKVATGTLNYGTTKSCGCLMRELASKRRRSNLKGKRFGRLTIIKSLGIKNKHQIWLCKCDCGRTIEVITGSLTVGNTKSCGCLHREMASKRTRAELKGKKFGRLTVVKSLGSVSGRQVWLCKCKCGNTTKVTTDSLNNRRIKSCGCLRLERLKKSMKEKIVNLKGKRFGRLTVAKSIRLVSGSHRWLCKCKCGNTTKVTTHDLISGTSKSCGCLKRELLSKRSRVNLKGEKFGKLIVVKSLGSDGGQQIWFCRCDCGQTTQVKTQALKSGSKRSCGCLQMRYFDDLDGSHMSIEDLKSNLLGVCTDAYYMSQLKRE